MKVRAILNPRAGLAARRALRAVEEGPWPGSEVRLTERPWHARELAQQAAAEGCELVLAVGGDGTVNEVAWGLLGTDAMLGLVPVGSGNGLARTLRIPLVAGGAVRALADGVTRRMDVGFANERPFLNVAGAGFDAVVGHDFHAHGKGGGRRGVFTYVRLSAARIFTYHPNDWRLEADGDRFEGRALVVAFVNGRQYGGGAVLAPRARLDDGRLDVVILRNAGLLRIAVAAPRLFLGGIERLGFYRHLRAARAVLATGAPFEHHRDGEPEDASDRLEIRVEPRALRVLVPRFCAEDSEGPFGSAPPG